MAHLAKCTMATLAALIFGSVLCVVEASDRPNVILCMADDLGWGDTGYNGHPHLRTPHLDQMAEEGVRFQRFYSAAPVCSPTRGSCLTGRHPSRYGVPFANSGHLKPQEISLAELLREVGYETGHFGKWHLGTLTSDVVDSNRGRPGRTDHYAPPWEHGFDVCFSTEAKVPTWNPMLTPAGPDAGKPYGTYYWTGAGQRVSENLNGDDSRVVMDRVIPFIRDATAAGNPFIAVIWFHTPHLPVVAGEEYLQQYVGFDTMLKHYYGCITAMDEQIGRLRSELASLDAAENTMLWFCSDNGPEGDSKAPGQTGGLRGRKRSLFEGGVRVPGLLVWPAKIHSPRTIMAPCVTSDYLPTVVAAVGEQLPDVPYDGVDLLPILIGEESQRRRPIAFKSQQQLCLIGERFKLYSSDNGKTFRLFDLMNDPRESTNVADEYPEQLTAMTATLAAWQASCEASSRGRDY